MGFDAIDQRREMKRRFAEGNYRGALELAEQVLASNPDDAIADAIATESRHELARLDEEPASSYAVEIDIEEEPGAPSPPSFKYYSSSPPTDEPTSSPAPSSQASRPTAPPGVSRTQTGLKAIRIEPNPAPAVDDLDAAWDAGNSLPPPAALSFEDTPNADATVALKGEGLEASLAAIDPSRPLDAEAADALARLMYEQFVAHKYTDAIETAQRILGAHPKERLALAIESQSRTALAREQALVVLVVPRAELAKHNLGAQASSVLSWVDGRRTVRDIAGAVRMNTWETLAILDELRVEGIVVLGAELDP